MISKVLSILFSVLLILTVVFYLKVIFEKNKVYEVKNQGIFIEDINIINSFCKNNLNPRTFSIKLSKGEEVYSFKNKICLKYRKSVYCRDIFCNISNKTILSNVVINKIYNCNLSINNNYLNINCS